MFNFFKEKRGFFRRGLWDAEGGLFSFEVGRRSARPTIEESDRGMGGTSLSRPPPLLPERDKRVPPI